MPTENDEIIAPPKFELNIYKCGLCDKYFSKLEDLTSHIANGKYFCSGFENLGPLEDHDQQIDVKLDYFIVCDICQDKFNNNQEYENHYKLHQEAILKMTKKKSPKNQEDLPGVWREIQKIKNEKIAEMSSSEIKFYKQSYYKGMTSDLLGVSRAEINLENNPGTSGGEENLAGKAPAEQHCLYKKKSWGFDHWGYVSRNGKPGSMNAKKCDFCLRVFFPKDDNEYVAYHLAKCQKFSEFAIDGKKCSFCNYFFRPYDKLLRHIENQHFTENNVTISGSNTSTQEFKEEKQNNKTIGQGVLRIIKCKYCNISFIADAVHEILPNTKVF